MPEQPSPIETWARRLTEDAAAGDTAAAVLRPQRVPRPVCVLVVAGRARTHCGFCRAPYSAFDAAALEAAIWVTAQGEVQPRAGIHDCGNALAAPIARHLPLPRRITGAAPGALTAAADALAREVAQALRERRRTLAEHSAAHLAKALNTAAQARAAVHDQDTYEQWANTYLTGSRQRPGVWEPGALAAWDLLDFPGDDLEPGDTAWTLRPITYEGTRRTAITVTHTHPPYPDQASRVSPRETAAPHADPA